MSEQKTIHRKNSVGNTYYRITDKIIEGFSIIDVRGLYKLTYERMPLPDEKRELAGFINSTCHCSESEYARKLGEYSVRHDEAMMDSMLPSHIEPMLPPVPQPASTKPINPEKEDCA